MKLETLKQVKALTHKSYTFITGEEVNSKTFALFFCESLGRYYFCASMNGKTTTELLEDLGSHLSRRTKKRDERALSNYAFKIIECQNA